MVSTVAVQDLPGPYEMVAKVFKNASSYHATMLPSGTGKGNEY
jgi:hypothetical protein